MTQVNNHIGATLYVRISRNAYQPQEETAFQFWQLLQAAVAKTSINSSKSSRNRKNEGIIYVCIYVRY